MSTGIRQKKRAVLKLFPDDSEEAKEGEYTVNLNADGGGANEATLPLHISVALEEAGEGNFTAEYPEQQGASGTSFSFNTTLVNNGASAKTYSLSAEAPEGWMTTFTTSSDSTQVASVPVIRREAKA